MKDPISKIAVAIFCLFAIVVVANLPARAQSAAEKTFKAKCVACHGADGSGTDTGKKLGAHDFHSADAQKISDADLVNEISRGKNKMPAYGKTLKPDEIKDLAAYIRDLSKKS
jgi:cytochrome c6